MDNFRSFYMTYIYLFIFIADSVYNKYVIFMPVY